MSSFISSVPESFVIARPFTVSNPYFIANSFVIPNLIGYPAWLTRPVLEERDSRSSLE